MLLRLPEFILPPPHPSVKERLPRGVFPTINPRREPPSNFPYVPFKFSGRRWGHLEKPPKSASFCYEFWHGKYFFCILPRLLTISVFYHAPFDNHRSCSNKHTPCNPANPPNCSVPTSPRCHPCRRWPRRVKTPWPRSVCEFVPLCRKGSATGSHTLPHILAAL